MNSNETNKEKTSITCTVEKVVFHNKENGYSVLSVTADGEDKPFSICGPLKGVPKGTILNCEGEWIEHAKFGRQFQVESWEEKEVIKPSEIAATDLARFIAEKTNHNLFLTGKAGTGKTVFLRDFVEHTQKKVVVLAPTGIAALNSNGITIHSFCRFGLSPNPGGRVCKGNDYVLNENEEELVRNVDLIIIDEVSMVRADVMDHISEKIRLIRCSDKPFGGVQLMLIGDLYQLPPIVTKEDEYTLKGHYNSNYFFFNSKALRKVGFETVCLNKVYRQDTPEFVSLLNKARKGKITWYDCNKLNARFLPDFSIPEETNYITLVSQRKQADKINAEHLESIKEEGKCYSAEITGEFPADAYPTNSVLILKKGAQVMFVKNDKDNRYRNGAVGVVVDMDETKISVKTGDETIEVVPVSWDNISYKYDESTKRIQKTTAGTFKQYPIKPAWAITIHKSLGLTFDHAIIDIPHAFTSGQSYVALSRCRNLEGMVLKRKLTPESFFANPLISAFYDRVDNNTHIHRLAEAVGYTSFEWGEKLASVQSPKNEYLERVTEAIGAVNLQLNLYHETCSELDDEFWSIVSWAEDIIGDNIYYQMKLSKAVCSWDWWFKGEGKSISSSDSSFSELSYEH